MDIIGEVIETFSDDVCLTINVVYDDVIYDSVVFGKRLIQGYKLMFPVNKDAGRFVRLHIETDKHTDTGKINFYIVGGKVSFFRKILNRLGIK